MRNLLFVCCLSVCVSFFACLFMFVFVHSFVPLSFTKETWANKMNSISTWTNFRFAFYNYFLFQGC